MRTSYKPLVRVRLRHSFYADGRALGDFSVEPAPATRAVLEQSGLIFRALPDGFALYAEIVPGASPVLLRPLGTDPLRLVFLLNSVNSRFEQMTALPKHRPAGTVFHLTNLRQDVELDRLYLGDRSANARIGPAVVLVTSALFTYRITGPSTGVSLLLADMFGNPPRPVPYDLSSATQAASELRVNLAAVPALSAGRYILSDSAGGSVDLYYDTRLSGSSPVALIELFGTTLPLTGNGPDLVPEDYRFVTSDKIQTKDYYVQFDRLQTVWRYNVIKRYEANPIPLEELVVVGPVAFTGQVQSDRAVFTSQEPLALVERPHDIQLKQAETLIRKLPNPAIGTSMKKTDAEGAFVSEVNVYI